MELLNPMRFTSTVLCAHDELKQIAKLAGKYGGADAEKDFLRACKDPDVESANKILDRTVRAMTGQDSVSEAMYQLVKKFYPALCGEVSNEAFEFHKPSIIARRYNELKKAMGG